MPSLLDPSAREALRSRVHTLRPDVTPRWGRFTAPAMLAHLTASLRMMRGDLPVAPAPTPWVVRNPPLKQLLIYVLPFPKGLPTSPELLASPQATDAANWDEAVRTFDEALNALGDFPIEWPRHAAFGPMTGRQWGVLQYRHLDHHLRQFDA